MIRFIITISLVFLFLFCSIPLLIVEALIGLVWPRVRDYSCLYIIRAILRFLAWTAGAKPTIIGLENIPKDQAVLFVGNHRSYFDILLTYMNMNRPTGYIAKIEMSKPPLISHWMRCIHCLFLDRNDLKQGLQTILSAAEKIKNGISIFIFPEGTRNRGEDICLPFHEGSLKIAVKAKAPVIPVCITGSSAIWEDQFPRMCKAPVTVEFGKPVLIDELPPEDKKHPGAYVQKVIEEMYRSRQS